MATRKQTEEAFRKVIVAYDKLNAALIDAKNMGAMDEVESIQWAEKSPFAVLNKVRDRFYERFEGPIARAVMYDIRWKKK